MADIPKALVVNGVHTNLVDPTTGLSTNYKEVTTWYDGTPMTDAKTDGNLYRKRGNKYLRKVIDKDGELFLEKDTMTQMRALTAYEILLLKAGVVKGVRLNGYYTKGDTPSSIEYTLSTTPTSDNNSRVIEVGGVKLEGNFKGEVDIKYYGAVADANENDFTGTDNTAVILKAIQDTASIKSTLLIDGKYLTKQLKITVNNAKIVFSKTSYLVMHPDMGIVDRVFWLDVCNNVTVVGNGATIKAPIFSADEFRHIFYIKESTNVNVSDIIAEGGGGDGFDIVSISGQLCQNINLVRCVAKNNRRNGFSLINGRNIILTDCIAEDISGTAPVAGLDIEPNGYLGDTLEGVRIVNFTSKNCAGHGIDVAIGNYPKLENKYCDIVITGHTSINDGIDYNGAKGGGFRLAGNGYSGTWVNKVTGHVTYDGTIINPHGDGVSVTSWHSEKSPKGYIRATVSNVGTDSTGNFSGANVFNGAGSTFECGNVDLDLDVYDTRSTPNTYTGVYFQNGANGIKNVNVLLGGDYRTIQETKIINGGGSKLIGTVNFKNTIELSRAIALGTTSLTNYFGSTVKFSVSTTATLPLSSNFIGQSITLYGNLVGGAVTIAPTSPDKIIFNKNVDKPLLLSYGEEATLVAESDGWRVRKGNITKRVNSVGHATSRDIFWFNTMPTGTDWEDGTIAFKPNANVGDPIGWKYVASTSSWQVLGFVGGMPNASLSVKGAVNQSAYSADTATQASGANPTKAEFDALLAEFRDFKNKDRASGQSASS